jgi:hypothetical protein
LQRAPWWLRARPTLRLPHGRPRAHGHPGVRRPARGGAAFPACEKHDAGGCCAAGARLPGPCSCCGEPQAACTAPAVKEGRGYACLRGPVLCKRPCAYRACVALSLPRHTLKSRHYRAVGASQVEDRARTRSAQALRPTPVASALMPVRLEKSLLLSPRCVKSVSMIVQNPQRIPVPAGE